MVFKEMDDWIEDENTYWSAAARDFFNLIDYEDIRTQHWVPPHWIPIAADVNGKTKTFKCSACRSYAYTQFKNKNKCNYEYCPNCGRKMI